MIIQRPLVASCSSIFDTITRLVNLEFIFNLFQCPNCLDETQFFLSYIEENPNEDLAFVGLSVEAAKTEEKAMKRIKNMIDKFNIPYPILLAQYGGTDKEKFLEKIPMLENIISYPTTIIIDKSGKVNSIHTGFNGPATGQAYVDYKEDFKTEIKGLLEL